MNSYYHVNIQEREPYNTMNTNEQLAALYRHHLTSSFERYMPPKELNPYILGEGSTDMGNVSHFIPSIHPLFAIPAKDSIHTALFAEASKSREAHLATWKVAKAVAMSVVDVWCDSGVFENVLKAFADAK